MDDRDQFAIAALPSAVEIVTYAEEASYDKVAAIAYKIADAMMKHRVTPTTTVPADDNDGWIEWSGGVRPEGNVDIRTRHGREYFNQVTKAFDWKINDTPGDYDIVAYRPITWTDWNGDGEPDLPNNTRVAVKWRDGFEAEGPVGEIGWSHIGSDHDIVAYRVIR